MQKLFTPNGPADQKGIYQNEQRSKNGEIVRLGRNLRNLGTDNNKSNKLEQNQRMA